MKKIQRIKKAFTLLEVLLVVGIIAILAAIVIVAINPAKQLGEARNAQRWSDVNTILNATYQYYIDNGALPSSITTSQTEICKSGAGSCSGLIDLDVLTDDEKYLVALPNDPTEETTNGTGYEIERTSNNRVTVYAPGGANETSASETIEVTK